MIISGIPSRQPHREAWSMERLRHERALALGHAIDATTWKNYSSALNSYLDFVKKHYLPVDPTPDTLSFILCIFLTSLNPALLTPTSLAYANS